MIINLILHLTEEKSASFSLNMAKCLFINLDHINLRYSTVCTDRCINYVYNSTFHVADIFLRN